MTIKPEQVAELRSEYHCLITESQHRFSKPIVRPLSLGDTAEDTFQLEVETGIDVTLTKEYLHQLIVDAEEGRVMRQLRGRHPALVEAWDRYRMLAALTKAQHGL